MIIALVITFILALGVIIITLSILLPNSENIPKKYRLLMIILYIVCISISVLLAILIVRYFIDISIPNGLPL